MSSTEAYLYVFGVEDPRTSITVGVEDDGREESVLRAEARAAAEAEDPTAWLCRAVGPVHVHVEHVDLHVSRCTIGDPPTLPRPTGEVALEPAPVEPEA